MKYINKPIEPEKFKCWKCKTIIEVHPLADMNSRYIVDCDLHTLKKCEYELTQIQGEPMKFEYRCVACESSHATNLLNISR